MPLHTVRPMRPPIAVSRRGKILLVDEQPQDLARLGWLLEAEGHAVRRCSSYAKAIDLITDETFDLVLIGQGSSAREEKDLAEWARAADPNVPVLLLVENREAISIAEPLDAEVSARIAKPASLGEASEWKDTIRQYIRPHLFVLNFERTPH